MNNTAVIVKINNIEPHSNADKLQIVKLFGTQVVVGLDTKEGDRLIYVDSNMKMSKEFLHNNNLFRHSELNEDKEKQGFFDDSGRIKCIKLRGVLSDGFLFPTDYLNYLDVKKEKLLIGDELNSINGNIFCEKYIPPVRPQGSGSGNRNPSMKKLEVPMFKEHFSTGQFMREKQYIPADTICYIEEKIHGTSHRSANILMDNSLQMPKLKRYLYKLLKLPTFVWTYINGTRRVVHNPNKKYSTYHDNTMREEVLEQTRGLLLKGEEVYLELFGHEKTGSQIQKNFPYGTKPDSKDSYRTLLYRVTLNNEDGHSVDYSREAVYNKAKELGFEVPHLFEKFAYSGSRYSMKQLEERVIAYAQGQSELANDTLKEGVVIWFINSEGHWKALKYKSDKFRLKESGQKDKANYDEVN